MRNLVLAASIACLVSNLVPSVLFLLGRMDLPTVKTAMIWTTAAWYGVAAFLIYGKHATPAGKIDPDHEPFVP